MDLRQIKLFLKERPGYLKEGKKRLAAVLTKKSGKDVEIELCAEAIREVKRELSNSVIVTEQNSPSVDTSNLKIKSIWQSANGTWLTSYKAVDSQEVDKEDFILEALKDFKSYVPEEFKNKGGYKAGDCLLEVSLPDLHIGKHDVKKQAEEVYLVVKTFMERLPSNIKLDRILLPVGNDLLNTDNQKYVTTKGTPQFDTVEAQESFRTAWKIMTNVINELANYAPVDVIVIPGNHDDERSFYVGEVLNAMFSEHKGVTVDNGMDKRKYYRYGVTHFGFTHGDKEKIGDLPLLMAAECKKDYANAEYTEWHCGHIHKELTLLKVVDDVYSTKVRFLPSICDNDTWHKAMGYTSLREAQALMYSKKEGFIGLQAIRQK